MCVCVCVHVHEGVHVCMCMKACIRMYVQSHFDLSYKHGNIPTCSSIDLHHTVQACFPFYSRQEELEQQIGQSAPSVVQAPSTGGTAV